MEIRTYPSRNIFFNIGISALCDTGIHIRKNEQELIIVCMASWSVKDIVFASWLKSWSKSRILIVSDTRFFPLAKYFQIRNNDIIEVCHTSELYSVLGEFIWRGRFYRIEQEEDVNPLTDMEYISLQNALDGISAQKQAKLMGLSSKTVFTHRIASARKLNVKKLSHLLSPKILNSSKALR